MGKITASAVLMAIFIAGSALTSGQTAGKAVTDVILSGYSAKAFTTGQVSDEDIDIIVKCGMKAPSARNLQPWRFTVVKDTAIVRKIVRNVTPGNILIIVSGTGSGAGVDFDCGLAAQNMYIAAQALGLGAHIYGSPVGNINSTMKNDLGIPEDYRAITILRIGHVDKNVDAVSAASARKQKEQVVNFK